VRAVDATTGVERWVTRLNSVVGGAPPALSGTAVVVADTRGQVYRLDAATGARTWDFALNVPVLGAAPAIAGGAVLVPTAKGELAAIDLSTGEEIWHLSLGEGALLDLALTPSVIVVARTGPSAGLVGLVHDDGGTLERIQSPTILKPVVLFGAWAIAAIVVVAPLLWAGRYLSARLGPAEFADADEDEDADDEEEDDPDPSDEEDG
jgi:hypothetical protein